MNIEEFELGITHRYGKDAVSYVKAYARGEIGILSLAASVSADPEVLNLCETYKKIVSKQ